jgi:opacity protein-like surface antigen
MKMVGRSTWLILTIGVPLAAAASDPSIQAAETSVRLGLTGGDAAYSRLGPGMGGQNDGIVGVTAGFSDLSPSSVPGFLLPDFYANAGYEFSDGAISGAHGGGATPFADHSNAYNNTATIRLGAGTPIGSHMEAIPYIVAGYQNWSRNTAGPGWFGEFYQAEILGGGLRFDLAGSQRVVLSASAEGYAVLGGAGSGPSGNFDEGLGASAEERVSLDADYRLNRTWHAFAGLGVNHVEYEGSKSTTSGFDGSGGAALQVNSMFGLAYGF